MSINEKKCNTVSKKVVYETHFWNFGNPLLYHMVKVEARNFKFGIEIDDSVY